MSSSSIAFRSIYDQRYAYGSGSKANQIRGFWKIEANHVVGKLMGDLLDYAVEIGSVIKGTAWFQDSEKTVLRLKQGETGSGLGCPDISVRREGF